MIVVLASGTTTLATSLTAQVFPEVTMLNITQLNMRSIMTLSLIMGVISTNCQVMLP